MGNPIMLMSFKYRFFWISTPLQIKSFVKVIEIPNSLEIYSKSNSSLASPLSIYAKLKLYLINRSLEHYLFKKNSFTPILGNQIHLFAMK